MVWRHPPRLEVNLDCSTSTAFRYILLSSRLPASHRRVKPGHDKRTYARTARQQTRPLSGQPRLPAGIGGLSVPIMVAVGYQIFKGAPHFFTEKKRGRGLREKGTFY